MRHLHPLLLLLAASLISGCGGLLPEPAESPRVIDLGPGSDPNDDAEAIAAITLARVDAPRWLDDTAIHYRRLDHDPNTLERYAQHVWAAPPAELIAAEAEAMLRARGGRDGPPQARLELRLTRFEQVFESAEAAYVDARVSAVLIPRGNGATRQREFRARLDTRADVDGAVDALPRAAHEIIGDMGDWLAREHPPGD